MRNITLYLALALTTFGVGLAATVRFDLTDWSQPNHEAELRNNLYQMRKAIDRYAADRGHLPSSLSALVATGYLSEVPVDQMTGRKDWVVIMADGSTVSPAGAGIKDVHSLSKGKGLDGASHSEF